jgi:hypothetical protein
MSPSQDWPALCQLTTPHVLFAIEQPSGFAQNSSLRHGAPAPPGDWQVVPAFALTLHTSG